MESSISNSSNFDEKTLLANYQAALLHHHQQQQQQQQNERVSPSTSLSILNASGFRSNSSPGPNIPQQFHQQFPQVSMINQSQYMANLLQQNDISNVIQNSLASGVPTLDLPTIFSYLGGGVPLNDGPKNSKNILEYKYGKLLEVVQEIGRDVRPLYTGSKPASDRLRRQINQARCLVRECLMELDKRAQKSSNS
ncbi:Isocitrate dehydrogenase [Sarcoptes scabiei]|nr:Isocitrate dehydrogenase [Sarcoptes scabiei]